MSRHSSVLSRRVRKVGRQLIAGLPPGMGQVAKMVSTSVSAGPVLLAGPPPGPVLVVAPHPDDEVIGPGGTVALHHDAGDTVEVLVLTSGEAGAGGGADRAEVREAESRRALRHLGEGITPHFARLADGALQQSTDQVAALIGRYGAGAAAVYVPSLLDPHPDHAAVAAAVSTCGLDDDVLILGYEVWGVGPITALVDVTAVFGRKQAALAEYVVALQTVDYVRSASGLAAYRSSGGSLGGRGFAEGFVAMSLADYRRML